MFVLVRKLPRMTRQHHRDIPLKESQPTIFQVCGVSLQPAAQPIKSLPCFPDHGSQSAHNARHPARHYCPTEG